MSGRFSPFRSLNGFQSVKFSEIFSKRLHVSACIKTTNIPKLENVSTTSHEDKTVDFGFQTIPASEKAHKVHKVFENVASSYDLMNDVMSVGIHRIWKDYFVKNMFPLRPGTKIIDVAGGTGDIAFRMLQSIERQNKKFNINTNDVNDSRKNSSILISDINQSMLDVGKERAVKMNLQSDILSWLCADAQQLPLAENSFDLYTIAFGIRNVTEVSKMKATSVGLILCYNATVYNYRPTTKLLLCRDTFIPQALDEAYRILKPGGRFLCLEFSHVENPLLKWMYDTYSFQIIPPLGEVVAGDWKSYQYLVESIRKFPTQERFKDMIEEAGFRSVKYENLTFGIVSIHSGYKI